MDVCGGHRDGLAVVLDVRHMVSLFMLSVVGATSASYLYWKYLGRRVKWVDPETDRRLNAGYLYSLEDSSSGEESDAGGDAGGATVVGAPRFVQSWVRAPVRGPRSEVGDLDAEPEPTDELMDVIEGAPPFPCETVQINWSGNSRTWGVEYYEHEGDLEATVEEFENAYDRDARLDELIRDWNSKYLKVNVHPQHVSSFKEQPNLDPAGQFINALRKKAREKRRIMRHQYRVAAHIAAYAREEFGLLQYSEANRTILHQFCRDTMKEVYPTMRVADRAKQLPMAVAYAFLPSQSNIDSVMIESATAPMAMVAKVESTWVNPLAWFRSGRRMAK